MNEDAIYEEIAKAQIRATNFKCIGLKKHVILVTISSDNPKLFNRWKDALDLGCVLDQNSSTSWYGDIRSSPNSVSTLWKWDIPDMDGYIFCLGILPKLRKFWTYKVRYCEDCIEAYESRRH